MITHAKRKTAPIVVTAIMLIWYALYFLLLVKFLPPVWRVILCAVPVACGACMIAVCVQRIKEIDKGESQY